MYELVLSLTTLKINTIKKNPINVTQNIHKTIWLFSDDNTVTGAEFTAWLHHVSKKDPSRK